MAMRFNRRFNVNRVVKRLVYTILALYVGGTVLTVFGSVMNTTSSPFYTGLSLIGWTVETSPTNGTAGYYTGCGIATTSVTPVYNCITSTSGSGVLAVIGIIGIAQVVTEFVSW